MEINSKKFKTLQTTTITVLSGFLAETGCITLWCLNDGQLKVPTQREQEGNSAASTGEGALLLPPAVCWVPRDRPGAGCRATDFSHSLNYFFTSSKASRSTSWLASFPPSGAVYSTCSRSLLLVMSPAQRHPLALVGWSWTSPGTAPSSSWSCRAGRMQPAALSPPQWDKKELRKQIIWFLHGALFSISWCIWRVS